MKMNSLLSASLALFLSSPLAAGTARAADHGDAPGVRLDTRLDINDVYAFQSPANAANTVLIVTTNPLAGITGPLTYHPSADYDIIIDNNNDAKADITYRVKFKKPNAAGEQKFTVFRLQKAKQTGAKVATGKTGTTASVSGGGQITADNFDDPFFFDLLAFRNSLGFCPGGLGTNFFRGLNTLAIVLEVPSSDLVSGSSTSIGVYARTRFEGKQVDRMGRPAINTVLVTTANKDKFNRANPVNDAATFGADAKNIIVNTLGNTSANADSLVATLFPDLLTFDTASSGGFLNGRKLADDVIDAELNLLTNGGVTTDCVANDSTFGSTFPYLGTANP